MCCFSRQDGERSFWAFLMVKYILITGGVVSGIGKGVLASSTGLLLRQLGFKVTAVKVDPYLNIDAGTMSPFEHGEVFILNDGGEVRLLMAFLRKIWMLITRRRTLTSVTTSASWILSLARTTTSLLERSTAK